MNKQDFLKQLREGLTGLPEQDIEERIGFYSEMIDDRIEEGLSEEEAVFAVGNIDDIVEQIIDDFPFVKVAKERIKPKRRFKAWEITLLVLGAPLWLPLLIAAFIVILALYLTIWSVVASAWSVFVSLAACAPALLIVGVGFIAEGFALSGIVCISASLVCAGLAILIFYGCMAITKGFVFITHKTVLIIKKAFLKKGGEADEKRN